MKTNDWKRRTLKIYKGIYTMKQEEEKWGSR
jgi:hypothetical protein